MKYESRVIEMLHAPEGDKTFFENGIRVRIVDEAAGEFVEIESQADNPGKIGIDPDEWPALRSLIDKMVRSCRGE